MEAATVFAAIALLILLAVTSLRFGVDSREGFATKERDLASYGVIWVDAPRRAELSSIDEKRATKERRPAAHAA